MITIERIDGAIADKYKFIDLFAGIGGFHLALSSFGLECVFACEWDKYAAQIYEKNFQLKPHGDINNIQAGDIPAHQIVCAGFPCQAFSIAGKQKGFSDTRGTLFFQVVRIIEWHQPPVIFLENVKNLVRHDQGKTFDIVIKTLESLGYQVFHQIFNASDFGLPQNRQRIYIVAFHKNINAQNFIFPIPTYQPVCLQDILENNPTYAKIIQRDDINIYKNYLPKKLASGDIKLLNKPIQIGKVNKGGQGERIYHPLGHAITLSANGGGIGAKTGLYLIDGQVRKLSPRECARLQGFPDNFLLDASPSQAYKQFGNSVAINVLQNIFLEIDKILKLSQSASSK
ncbi:MAG: DNA (cytosine-5-)-methyltransferase [Microcoleaceae cyanobacterium]